MAGQTKDNFAYTTLVTKASYLSGVLLLAHTLRKHGAVYPLVVFYVPTLDKAAKRALELEAPKSNIVLKSCSLLLPPGNPKIKFMHERFEDTWTKLRVFDLFEYDTVFYLDADIMILANPDPIFTNVVIPEDHIGVCHDCTCNYGPKNEWCSEEWNPKNCAYTTQSHPEALTKPIQPTPSSRRTYHAINTGTILYHPSPKLSADILNYFNTTDKLESFKCPDQDLLETFFHNRFITLPWKYNATKTMRRRHPNIWRDDKVVSLHYIVEKPWSARVGKDGKAGYMGLDGETHQWWWDKYEEWKKLRESEGAVEVVEITARYVADPLVDTLRSGHNGEHVGEMNGKKGVETNGVKPDGSFGEVNGKSNGEKSAELGGEHNGELNPGSEA